MNLLALMQSISELEDEQQVSEEKTLGSSVFLCWSFKVTLSMDKSFVRFFFLAALKAVGAGLSFVNVYLTGAILQ